MRCSSHSSHLNYAAYLSGPRGEHRPDAQDANRGGGAAAPSAAASVLAAASSQGLSFVRTGGRAPQGLTLPHTIETGGGGKPRAAGGPNRQTSRRASNKRSHDEDEETTNAPGGQADGKGRARTIDEDVDSDPTESVPSEFESDSGGGGGVGSGGTRVVPLRSACPTPETRMDNRYVPKACLGWGLDAAFNEATPRLLICIQRALEEEALDVPEI